MEKWNWKDKPRREKLLWLLTGILAVLALVLLGLVVGMGLFPSVFAWLAAGVVLVVTGLVLGFLWYFRDTKTAFRIFCGICTICIVLYGVCIGSLVQASSFLDSLNQTDNSVIRVQVLVKKDGKYNTLKDLSHKQVGYVAGNSDTAVASLFDRIRQDGVSVNKMAFSDMETAARSLENDGIAALVLTDGAIVELEYARDENLRDFETRTKSIYQYEYEVFSSPVNSHAKVSREPFQVLVTGVDSRDGFDEVGRSDVNMLVTVNPVTQKVLLTSIPRDYYVEIACPDSYACKAGTRDKLTHTGYHSSETTKKTIENLLDTKINYTVKVNFDSVVDLVDELGGIDVDIDEDEALYWLPAGKNHLDGYEALTYARERYAYAEGDRHRVQNQQDVLLGIAEKLTKPSVLKKFPSLMKALQGAILTDMSSTQMKELVQYQLDEAPDWDFERQTLDGEDDYRECPEIGQEAYVMIPDADSVNTAKNAIRNVMAGN